MVVNGHSDIPPLKLLQALKHFGAENGQTNIEAVWQLLRFV